MITAYTYDRTRVYSGEVQCDPMKALPPCLLTPPPNLEGTQVAKAEGSTWVVLPSYPAEATIPLVQRQDKVWTKIKAERDRRKSLGVKVGAHWFHSDDSSRIQQIALTMMGSAMPAGLQWKTLTLTPPPVFVTMTPALAGSIFQAIVSSDQSIFTAAEVHRVTMESLDNPEDYDFTSGWPTSIEEE